MTSKSKPIYCAAVDLGATSGRVILGKWDGDCLTTVEVHRFPNALRSLGAHDYWDLGGLWAQVQVGLRRAVEALPTSAQLASVGVDSWGVDHVLVNRSGRLVFPSHAYRDGRTQRSLQTLLKRRAAYARIYAATGIPAVFYNTSLQLAETVASCPEVTALAARCLFLPDYFNHLLTGKMVHGLAIASTSQLLDVHTGNWSSVALDHFGLPAKWFSKPVKSGTCLGTVRDQPGLAQTQVIVVPGHDTACAFEALPSKEADTDLFISSGTWSLVGYKSDRPQLGDEALAAGIANERAGDDRYRPLTNVIGLWLLECTLAEFASRPANDRAWRQLIRAAAAAPRPRRLLDVTDPAFGNPPSMRTSIDAQLKRHRTRPPRDLAGYVRLICDSLGRGHADVARRFERLGGRRFSRVLMVGGGAKNPLLCQATADAVGLPVVALEVEGSALGNLGSQLIALGAFHDFADFRRRVIHPLPARTFRPRSAPPPR